MEDQFITYELSLELKKLGFNERCLAVYGKLEQTLYFPKSEFDSIDEIHFIKAPLWQQAFDWFREEKNQWTYLYPNIFDKCWCYHIQEYVQGEYWGALHIKNKFKTYEEARLGCLKKLIQLTK